MATFKTTFKSKILVETKTYHTYGANLAISYREFKKMIDKGHYELEVVKPMFSYDNEPTIIIREKKS